MRENRLLDNFRANRSTTVCQMYFPSTTVVEMIGLAGIDAVLFDAEHGTFTREDLDDLCRVAGACDLLTIARMPDLEPATAQGFLDRGVQSIIGPGVSTAAGAMKLVEGCRYAPLGKRGIGGAPRAARFRNVSTRERIDRVNRNTFVVAFLEAQNRWRIWMPSWPSPESTPITSARRTWPWRSGIREKSAIRKSFKRPTKFARLPSAAGGSILAT